MTQFVEPNKNSDLTAPIVRSWFQIFRDGILEGFTVSDGGGPAFEIDITSGKLVIDGTTVYDDETYLGSTLLNSLSPSAGDNLHVIVYATYSYTDTFPPAAMTFGFQSVSAVAPLLPAAPSLPADSIKLCDIHIPSGSTDLSTSTIINAQPLPDDGATVSDQMIERIAASNAGTVIGGGTPFTYDGGADTLTWGADITLFAPVTTNESKYETVPVAYGTIAAGVIGSVGDNVVFFTLLDRTSSNAVGSPVALTMYAADLVDNTAGLSYDVFMNPDNADKIVVLGTTVGGVFTSKVNPDISGDLAAHESASPAHAASAISVAPYLTITATDAQAAIQELEDDKAGGATSQALQPNPGGTPSPSIEDLAVNNVVVERYGIGVYDSCVVSQPSGIDIRIGPGEFVDNRGQRVVVSANQDVTPTAADGTYVIYWNISSDSFASINASTGLDAQNMPFAIIKLSGGGAVVDGWWDVRRHASGVRDPKGSLTVGLNVDDNAGQQNFTTLEACLMHLACMHNTSESVKDIVITRDVNLAIDGVSGIDLATGNGIFDYATERLEGLTIRGKSSFGVNRSPQLRWTTAEPGIDVANKNRHWTFKNVEFTFLGTGNTSNHDITVLKDPRAGLLCDGMSVNGSSDLTHVCYWSLVGSFGGNSNAGDVSVPTVFRNSSFFNLTSGTGFTSAFYITSSPDGMLVVENCYFHSANSWKYFLEATSATATFDLYVDNCNFEGIGDSIYSHGATIEKGKKIFSNCRFDSPTSLKVNDAAVPTGFLFNCVFDGGMTIDTEGAKIIENGVCQGGTKISGDQNTVFMNCDFHTDGEFRNYFQIIDNCKIKVTGTFSIFSDGLNIGGPLQAIRGSFIEKFDANNRILNIKGTILVSNNIIDYAAGSVNTDHMIVDNTDSISSLFFIGNRICGNVTRPQDVIRASVNTNYWYIIGNEISTEARTIVTTTSGCEFYVIGNKLVNLGNSMAAGFSVINFAGNNSMSFVIGNHIRSSAQNNMILDAGQGYMIYIGNVINNSNGGAFNSFTELGFGGGGNGKAVLIGNILKGDGASTAMFLRISCSGAQGAGVMIGNILEQGSSISPIASYLSNNAPNRYGGYNAGGDNDFLGTKNLSY